MSWIPRLSFCSISSVAAPGNNAQHPGTGWIWDSPSPHHCSKYLPAYSLWVMSIIPCWLIHYSQVNPCVVAWKWNMKRHFYINFFLNMLLSILAQLKKKVLSKTRSAHVLLGNMSHSQHFQEMPHCSLMDQFQIFPLLPVITAAQASPLPLSGHVFGWPSSCLDLHCYCGPSTGGQHFTHALSTRQQSLMILPPDFSSFHPSLSQGKIPISVSLLREQESRDQHPAAPGMLCSSFKKLSFKKRIRVATRCSFSVLSWTSVPRVCYVFTKCPKGTQWVPSAPQWVTLKSSLHATAEVMSPTATCAAYGSHDISTRVK